MDRPPPPPPAPETAPLPTGDRPFTVAVHGDAGFPETVTVVTHLTPQGETVFVATDESGRIFRRRTHGLTGVVEIGASR